MTVDFTAFPASLDLLHLILGGLALILLLVVLLRGKAAAPAVSAPAPVAPPEAPQPQVAVQQPPALKVNSPDAALQLLGLLQQEARFVDFLQEDLKGFSDADVGAAARVVHEGGRKTLQQYFTLQAIRSEDEESRITLPAGFNAAEVRVTGNVVGQPPFTGTLIHRGWRVTDITLPKLAEGHDARIIAPAEVEL